MRLAPSTLRRAALMAAACGSILLASPLSLRADPRPATSSEDDVGQVAAGEGAKADEQDERVPKPPEQLRRIEQVTVTATRAERDVLDIPGNVTVIGREEIEESGASDIPELLRRESGIYVTNDTSNPAGYMVAPRGFQNGSGTGGANLLVLVDGRRVNEPASSVPDWALLPLENVERIEIVRGPASAVYGDNAAGGVVQIVTQQPEGPLSGEITGRTGTYDLDGGSVSVRGSHGPVGASVFAKGWSTDGFREGADFRSRMFDGKVRFSLDEATDLTLAGGYSSDDRKTAGSLSEADLELLGRDALDPRNGGEPNVAEERRRYGQARLEFRPSEDFGVEALAYHRYETTESEFFFGGTPFPTERDADSSGLNLKTELDTRVTGRRLRTVFGVDLLREDLESGSPRIGGPANQTRSRRYALGAFLQEELALTPDLLLSGGLRFDRAGYDLKSKGAPSMADPAPPESSTKEYFNAWSPKAALTYRVTDPISVYASYSRGMRFPNIDEFSGVLTGNPEIDPQKSQAYEVGVKMRSERFEGNLAVYHMDVDDEILFNPTAGSFGRNVNIDEVRHRGVEASFRLQLVEWLELYGSYTFDDTEVTSDALTDLEGEDIPVTPDHRGTAGVLFRLPYSIELAANGNFVGSRGLRSDLTGDVEDLGKYSTYDAHIRYHPEVREDLELELGLAVRNLFDREYSEVAGVASSFAPGASPTRRFFPAPGRHYELSATVRWR